MVGGISFAVLLATVAALLAQPARAECEGGLAATCKCLLSCEIFGGRPEKCANSTSAVAQEYVDQALQKSGDVCEEITCVVQCASRLGCLEKSIQDSCSIVKEHRACEVACDGSAALRSAGGSAGAAAVLAAAATLGATSAVWW
mmetsp:Transcript_52309/g.147260  ORF Transcript_52309/g.147260 Transcript_52309/m.147260 type:complete len:144 (-) Transcript_52309:301-732(-)